MDVTINKYMFIFWNYPDLMNVLGPYQIRFTETDVELERANYDKDYALSLGQFEGGIPTAKKVQVFIQDDRNWTFWYEATPKVSREQAFLDYYKR